MGNKISDNFRQKLDSEVNAEQEAPPVPMTFDDIECMVRPLDLAFFIRSGRMPDYLARIAMTPGNPEVAAREVANVTAEQVLEGQRQTRAKARSN